MDFLVNENFPLSSIGILRYNSHNIKSIAAEFSGITDKEVMDIALREDLTILTFDRDYGELIFKYDYKPSAGVILFRWDHFSPTEPGQFLVELLRNSSFDFRKCLTVISRNSIRQRKY
jgi:predicted nuclease of predicted toxin-antitoxin system